MLVVTLGGSPSQRSRSGVLLDRSRRWLQERGVEVVSYQVRDFPAEDLLHARFDSPKLLDLLQQIDQADGLLINSIKSCNSFSAGQLLMMREIEKRTGKPAAFIETDLVDPRYFSAANVKNRLESLRLIEGALEELIRLCGASRGNVRCPLIATLRSDASLTLGANACAR